jgi:hypothetical protein
MKRIPKSQYLPVLLLLVGIAFYVYYGVTWNAWHENIANLLIYIVIIGALFWSLRKKEKMEKERKGNS